MGDASNALAESFLQQCRTHGLDPPSELRLLGGRRPPNTPTLPVAPEGLDPFVLGEYHEQLLTGDERRGRGAWYTPRWLAGELVERTVSEVGVVVDLACGGGVFLLCVAQRLHALGARPADVVGSLLWGADIDETAVAVTEAALWSWSADLGEPTVAGDRLVVGHALTEVPIPSCSAVVGNPPFLGQLRRTTAVDERTRTALKARFDGCVAPYTDIAWLFLLAATEAVHAGGRATLIQPQSLLAARDAAPVRNRIDRLAHVESCWIDDGDTFAASVDVCAPTLLRRPLLGCQERSGSPDQQPGTGSSGRAMPDDWTAPLLEHLGVPAVALPQVSGPLGEQAEVIAGFRDEYYGLVDAVRDGGDGPLLVTSGAIDPLIRREGVAVAFARTRWTDPRIDIGAANGRGRAWVEAQLRPSLLVASQTKVIEALVDEQGDLVIGVPGIAVLPRDDARIWHLAAALHAPCISAWMLARTAGTGMSAAACRPTARLLGEVPLPGDGAAWDRAAALAKSIAAGADHWTDFAGAADAAYGVDDPDLRRWWLDRLPR